MANAHKPVPITFEQNFFHVRDLMQTLLRVKDRTYCKHCTELEMIRYCLDLKFPTMHRTDLKKSVDALKNLEYPSITLLLLQIFYLLDIQRFFQVELFE